MKHTKHMNKQVLNFAAHIKVYMIKFQYGKQNSYAKVNKNNYFHANTTIIALIHCTFLSGK